MQAGTCPTCGSPVQPGAEFCTVCGTRLAGLGRPAATMPGAGGAVPAPPPPAPVAPSYGPVAPPTQPLPSAPTTESLWPPSAPAYTPRPPEARRRVAVRPVAVAGAIVTAVAAFLPWVRFDFDATAFKIPLKFLFQAEGGSTSPNAGIVLLVVAALGLVLTFIPSASVARRLLGLAGLAVAALFVLQLLRFRTVTVGDLISNLGVGTYAAAVGGLLLAAG